MCTLVFLFQMSGEPNYCAAIKLCFEFEYNYKESDCYLINGHSFTKDLVYVICCFVYVFDVKFTIKFEY